MKAGFIVTVLCGLALLGVGATPARGQAPEKTLWQPYYVTPRAGSQHVSLNGKWELGYRDAPITSLEELGSQPEWIAAQVPSSVQWALFRAGKLPNPYLHMNARKYDWVVEKVWYYRKSFQVPASAKGQYVFLCFDGIDYYARIWLNGQELGRHEGMYSGPTVEVSSLLRSDAPNEIIVEVRAANYGVGDKWKPWVPGKVTASWGVTGGLDLITGGGGRKWGTNGAVGGSVGVEDYFPVGIWRGVRMEIVPPIHLERPFLVTRTANEQEASLELTTEVLAHTYFADFQLHAWKGNTPGGFRRAWTSAVVPLPLRLQVQLVDKDTSRTVLSQSFPLKIYEGRNWATQGIKVPSPKLWWPNGMGDPHLYTVKLTLVQQGKPVDAMEFDYGIRTIRHIASAGPRTQDRWNGWQFVVNGRKFFVKGMDWWTTDILLDLPRDRYEWILGSAQAGGIQMLRTWGAGILETDDFYELCNKLGIMIWQDFPIGNMDTPDWPQDVWEAQVLQNIFRIRNQPSLAVYCGGNEFNPYSTGNTAAIGIMERSVADFDGTRLFLRTTPDPGDLHTYPNLDPTWYQYLYPQVPYISETGPHSIPEAATIREFVDAHELDGPLRNINSQEFMDSHPDFVYHNMEYGTNRTEVLLARASQFDDMRAPTLEQYSVAGQAATGEFMQIVSDIAQANYPVTTGLMPWVYNTPWPLSTFCMFVDYEGQPVASYYFLKRTYEPTHLVVRLPQLVWAPGATVPISASVIHSPAAGRSGLAASVEIFDDQFRSLWRARRPVSAQPGPSVNNVDLGEFTIPSAFEDKFFFVVAELKDAGGALVSRSVYWPRSLKLMEDRDFREKYYAAPQRSLVFEHGPWLRKQVEAAPTTLALEVIAQKETGENRSQVEVRVRNTGARPAFFVDVNLDGTKRAFYGTDNFFWLPAGEARRLQFEVRWRDPATRDQAVWTAAAWNAQRTTAGTTRH